MNHEAEPDAASGECFFKGQDVNLVDRIWLLSHYRDPDLFEGNYLTHYPFHPDTVVSIFRQEPELPLYLRFLKSERLARPDEAATAVSRWNNSRREQSHRLYQDLTMATLPLTLCTVYEHSGNHYWLLRRLETEAAFEYLDNVIAYHTEELVLSFHWDSGITVQDNVNRFIAYARKSLHPSRLRRKRREIAFCELSRMSRQSIDTGHDEDERLEQVIFRYTGQADDQGKQTLEVLDAVHGFREGLPPQSQARLDELLMYYQDPQPGASIRHDTKLFWSLRRYLRQSGFRPEVQGIGRGRRQQGRTLRAEGNGGRRSWNDEVAAMLSVYPARAFLLSPQQKAIVERVAQFHSNGHNFDTVVRHIAQDLDSTPGNIRAQFWKAKRTLLLEEKNDGRRLFKERKHRATASLYAVARKLGSGERVSGLSSKDSEIVRYKAAHPDASYVKVGEALGLSADTVGRTLKKVADSVAQVDFAPRIY